jgi:hypothetical protein
MEKGDVEMRLRIESRSSPGFNSRCSVSTLKFKFRFRFRFRRKTLKKGPSNGFDQRDFPIIIKMMTGWKKKKRVKRALQLVQSEIVMGFFLCIILQQQKG